MNDSDYLENETIRPCDGELGICPMIHKAGRLEKENKLFRKISDQDDEKYNDLKRKADLLVELLNDIANSNELEYSWNVEIRDAIKKYRGNE